MKLLKVHIFVFSLILIGCEKKEEISQTSIPEIQNINIIPATGEVGDTIIFEFSFYAKSGLNLIEFTIEDSTLFIKDNNFLTVVSDSIKFCYPVLCNDLGRLLNFRITAKDKSGKSNFKNMSVQISDVISVDYVMLKVEDVYSSAISYRDTGIVKTTIITEPPFADKRYVERPFKTAFLRDGRYRYESREIGIENSIDIIHRDENGVVKCWWLNSEEIMESLSLAITVEAIFSSSPANIIPILLLPDELEGINWLKKLKNKWIERTESFQGIDYYILSASNLDGDMYSIMIQKSNFLIRRIDYEQHLQTSVTIMYTEILPEINIEIDEKELEFNPPIY